jgi:hypothetical protein
LFITIAKKYFDSLLLGLGYIVFNVNETLLTYKKDDTIVSIYYGIRMHQVGFEIEYKGKTYDITSLIDCIEGRDKVFSRFSATDKNNIEPAMVKLYDLVNEYALPFLVGNEELFRELSIKLKETYRDDFIGYRFGPLFKEAEKLWIKRDYKNLFNCYKEIPYDYLSSVHLRRFAFVKKKLGL